MTLQAARICGNTACQAPLRPRASGRGYDGACGYCRPCYTRWARAGRPEDGPPLPVPLAEAAARAAANRSRARVTRIDAYAKTRAEDGQSRDVAAVCAGVTVITTYKYDRALREPGWLSGKARNAATAREAYKQRMAERREEYAWLRDGGVPPESAAERLGVAAGQMAARYETDYQDQRQERRQAA